MGIYRFVLSIMVALSHSGIFYWGVNQGTVLNLMLLPLNFTFLSTGLQTAMDACRVIPAAWTMGVQLTYYIAAPFLHVFREKKNYINILLFTVSLLLYVLTLRGNLSPVWGYGLLLGMLWIFIMGIYLYKDGVKEKGFFMACIL